MDASHGKHLGVFFLLLLCTSSGEDLDYPQGYYPFEESPSKIPPKVRKPPYLQTQVSCPGLSQRDAEQTLNNLCGDLNKGYLPLNPMGQNIGGVSYPFDLLKKKTLSFFSKTLPILKADDTLPRVAKYEDKHISKNFLLFNSSPLSRISYYHRREKRSSNSRKARASWCDDESSNVLCKLISAFQGKDPSKAADRIGGSNSVSSQSKDFPLTPCPSAVEYVTPVFAKNYQGVWRYVVQIPYEGYFTQTVEVVKCLSTKCEYLDGSCLASPRWVSLLVAEIFYPDTSFPNPTNPQRRKPVGGNFPPKGFQKRADDADPSCDGRDEMGCYQVRLYYDWFLIPGSCKCWKNDFLITK